MEFLIIIFGISLAVGLFMLLANALKIPYLKTSQDLSGGYEHGQKRQKAVEIY